MFNSFKVLDKRFYCFKQVGRIFDYLKKNLIKTLLPWREHELSLVDIYYQGERNNIFFINYGVKFLLMNHKEKNIYGVTV